MPAFVLRVSALLKTAECGVTFRFHHTTPEMLLLIINVQLFFSSNLVSHCNDERRARWIKGNEREKLKSKLIDQKPSTICHQQLLKLPPAAFHSGKRDGVGVSESVMQKISSESAKSQYLDEDLCKSLIIMRENQIEEE